MKAVLSGLFTVIIAASAHAAVKIDRLGDLAAYSIVRTVNKDKGTVCFAVTGDEGAAISCVKRAVRSAPPYLKVGTINAYEIKSIKDDIFQIECTAATGDMGSAISCE